MRRDLTAPDGAFYSAEDADSLTSSRRGAHGHAPEKREGAFYVWTAGEIERLLGDDAPIVRAAIRRRGRAATRWRDPQGEFDGSEHPVRRAVDRGRRGANGRLGRRGDGGSRARAGRRCSTARGARPRPHLDDKIITAWNGLMIAAFARAARQLVDSPRRAEWRHGRRARGRVGVREHLWRRPSGGCCGGYRDGEAAIDAFCEDYAYLVLGRARAVPDDRRHAMARLGARADRRCRPSCFFDERDGGWFSTTGEDPSVLLRLKEDYDGAEPAAASVTVRNLIDARPPRGGRDASSNAPSARSSATDRRSAASCA